MTKLPDCPGCKIERSYTSLDPHSGIPAAQGLHGLVRTL